MRCRRSDHPISFRSRGTPLGVKDRCCGNTGLQALQRHLHEVHPPSRLMSLASGRVSHGILDPCPVNDPGRTCGLGDRGESRYMSGGDTSSFYFFADRCTATSAGTSGAGQNHPLNVFTRERLCHSLPNPSRTLNIGSLSTQGIKIVV